jgi:phosphoribosylformylglycinamidine synthase I
MSAARVAVVVFPGTNGDRDLYETFARAGYTPFYHPSRQPLPADARVAALPGGFSYGDYWRAGMLASQAPAVLSLPELVARGGLVLGVCNGFQILVEAGLLPGALRYNDPPLFCHRWITVQATGARPSPWFHGIEAGMRLRMPMAHGEGNYFHPDGEDAIRAFVPLTYTTNPNGSLADAAALLDDTGRVLGIMPHPERAADPDLGSADGMRIFEAARAWLASSGGVK